MARNALAWQPELPEGFRPRGPVADRFWPKVAVGDPDDCWEWQGTQCPGAPYGFIAIGRRLERPHRVAWQLTNGPVPDGRYVCHHCDNPPCCNPSHLYAGTPADNLHDRNRRGRVQYARGEIHGSAKLREDDVHLIRTLRTEGWTHSAIASAFGVAKPTVSDVLAGRTWAWLAEASA